MDAFTAAADEEHLASLIGEAHARRRPLELVGAGTRRAFGGVVSAETVVSTQALSGVTRYEPEELVLTARASTPMHALETLLAEHGQHFAFEPPDFAAAWSLPEGRGTLAGSLALGLGGPRRPFAGAPRDHVLGVRAINGAGQAFGAGGRVVKNVTGFDLPKLLTGSLGVLAALVEVTVKVVPAPEAEVTLLVACASRRSGLAVLRAASSASVQVSGAALLDLQAARDLGLPIAAHVALVRLEGASGGLAQRLSLLTQALVDLGALDVVDGELSRAAWRSLRDVRLLGGSQDAIWRISLPAAAADACAERLVADCQARVIHDWAGALIWATVAAPHDDPERIRGCVREAGGPDAHATLLRGSPRHRAAALEPLRPGIASLTQRLKAQFDPRGVLNPGRMYRDL